MPLTGIEPAVGSTVTRVLVQAYKYRKWRFLNPLPVARPEASLDRQTPTFRLLKQGPLCSIRFLESRRGGRPWRWYGGSRGNGELLDKLGGQVIGKEAIEGVRCRKFGHP